MPGPAHAGPPASAWSDLVEDWLALRRAAMRLLADHDLLLMPVHPEPARPPHELEQRDRLRGIKETQVGRTTELSGVRDERKEIDVESRSVEKQAIASRAEAAGASERFDRASDRIVRLSLQQDEIRR